MNWKLLKSKCRTLQCHSLKSFFKIHVEKHCIFMLDFPFNVRVISKSLKKKIHWDNGALPQAYKAVCLCDYCCSKGFCVVQYPLSTGFSDHDLEAITVYS